MKKHFHEFRQRKVSVAVIAPHDAGRVGKLWDEEKLAFIGIPDQDHRLAGLYGQQWNVLKLGRMPALFVVRQDGRLALAHYGGSMADIPAAAELLAAIDESQIREVTGRD